MKIFLAVLFLAFNSLDALAWENYAGRTLIAYLREVNEGNILLVNESRWSKKNDFSIRFYGIGIPTERQPFGSRAHEEILKLLPKGQKLLLTTVNENSNGIISALVQVDDRSVNNQLLDLGLAWVDRSTCKAFFCRRWHIQESLAIKEKRGLWSLSIPTPPWQWSER